MMEKKQITDFGFKESLRKPDLFYKSISKAVLYFDFRVEFNNTFYFEVKGKEELTEEEKIYYNKLIINEFFKVIKAAHIFVEFMSLTKCEICEKKLCISYDGELFVCSKSCLEKAKRQREEYRIQEILEVFNDREKLKCVICGDAPKLDFEEGFCYVEEPKRHNHHLDYREGKEKEIWICPDCHAKITFHLDKYPELMKYKPVGSRKEMLEAKAKIKKYCKVCGKLLENKQQKYCCECRERKKRIPKTKNAIHNFNINVDEYKKGMYEKHKLILEAFENTGR